MGGLLRAQEGKERVLSSLRDPSQLDQDPSKTAALNQDRLLENISKEEKDQCGRRWGISFDIIPLLDVLKEDEFKDSS
jgi:hypothetical protein